MDVGRWGFVKGGRRRGKKGIEARPGSSNQIGDPVGSSIWLGMRRKKRMLGGGGVNAGGRWPEKEPGIDVRDGLAEDVAHALARPPPVRRIVLRTWHRNDADRDL